MSENQAYRKEIEKELGRCESRLKELSGKAETPDLQAELGRLQNEMKACRLKLDEIEHKSGDEWLDAKHEITTSLENIKKNLNLTGRNLGIEI
jgi:hypothetical protein